MEQANTSPRGHEEQLEELVRDYHKAFCDKNRSGPPIPESERRICLEQIYSIAEGWGFAGETVDAMMDAAEKKYAVYEEV